MPSTNVDIRSVAKENGVCLWKIAEAMGICDTTMSKKLRKELPAEEKERIINIIAEIAKRKEH